MSSSDIWGESKSEKEKKNAAVQDSMDIIMKWKPHSEVFALKNFMYASAIFTSSSAAYINAHYRKVVKLKNQGFIITLIPIIAAPSVFAGMLHHLFVQRPMLVETFKCPVCLELRGGIAQLFSGFVYPLFLAPLAAFQLATKLYTYPVPDGRDLKRVIIEIYKITKPALPRFYILAGLQIVAGMAWTHWELYNLHTVLAKMHEMEEAVREYQLWKRSYMAERDWMYGFMQRNQNISLWSPEATSIAYGAPTSLNNFPEKLSIFQRLVLT